MNTLSHNHRNRIQLLRFVGTVGTLGLLVFLLQKQGWSEIQNVFQQVSLKSFFLCMLLVFISRFAVVGRWHILLGAVEDVTLWQSISLTFAGLFATNFLPTTVGGDLVRLAGAIQLNIDGVMVTASLIVDRLIGMLGMALVLPFGAKSLLAWLTTACINQQEIICGLSISWVKQIWEKVTNLIQRVYNALLEWSKCPERLLISFGFTIIHMLCFFGINMVLLNNLGENLSLGFIAGLWSFVYFFTLLPISINGLGVQEISIAFIFVEVGGISLHSSLAISVLFRMFLMLGSLPGALFLPGIIAGAKEKGERII